MTVAMAQDLLNTRLSSMAISPGNAAEPGKEAARQAVRCDHMGVQLTDAMAKVLQRGGQQEKGGERKEQAKGTAHSPGRKDDAHALCRRVPHHRHAALHRSAIVHAPAAVATVLGVTRRRHGHVVCSVIHVGDRHKIRQGVNVVRKKAADITLVTVPGMI